MTIKINLLFSSKWTDYELLDSGDGQKLERFGPYVFARPEVQALWRQALPAEKWQAAHAFFNPSGEESGGHWSFIRPVAEKWEMSYPLFSSPLPSGDGLGVRELRFFAKTTPGRHLGVFPECAANWDWMAEKIMHKAGQVNVLNLFGYTGLGTLAAAAAGAKITHVDASKKSVAWARENQILSGLSEKPIRWIVDDTLKFVEREQRRGVKYDGLLLDPPKFGRGPKGEVWEIYKSLPEILQACRALLSESPLFVLLTLYAVKLSALHAFSALAQTMEGFGGNLECGELVTKERSAGRLLSQAVYARWTPIKDNLI
ncbi:MAG: class I SAM-dependent methyltransferase [Anaerolineales bacterium]|jgi:23S rRNA (cytosine1962-C5)-methyltransferase